MKSGRPSAYSERVDDDGGNTSLLEKGPEAEHMSHFPRSRRRLPCGAITGSLGLVILSLISFLYIASRQPDSPALRGQSNPNLNGLLRKPVLALQNFPDPGLIRHGDAWYAFGTNGEGASTRVSRVPVAISHDFVHWNLIMGHDALPFVGMWEDEVDHWAPDVIRRGDGRFVLYYSGGLKDWKPHHCVGAAVSQDKHPVGPYIPLPNPLACTIEYGGSIDPSPFRDIDGTLYVTYKADGNCIGHGGDCNNGIDPIVPVPLMLQELQSDGVTPVGNPIEILDIDESDGPLVEAPNIVRTKWGMYFLFFSSHCFNSPDYNVKYAYSNSLEGPYERASRPLLKTGDFDLMSPGGATFSEDGTKMVFHAACETGRCMYSIGADIHADGNITLLNPQVYS